MGQWQLVVIILSLYETNSWIPSFLMIVGVYNTTKTITSPVNVFTVPVHGGHASEGCKTSGATPLYGAPHLAA